MSFTVAYLGMAIKDVKDLFKIHKSYWDEPRYKILKEFCKNGSKILSVGCACKEPIIINATHAIDIVTVSEQLLSKNGYKGKFKVGSCTDLPYLDKSFDIVVCSEVIEHLPTIDDVIKTFKEVSRVGKKWIITTPNSDVIKPKDQNFTHQQFFTYDKIKKIIPGNYSIYKHDHHIYVESF